MADTLGKKDLDDAPVSQVEETNVEVVKQFVPQSLCARYTFVNTL